jgi:hypothetical protein
MLLIHVTAFDIPSQSFSSLKSSPNHASIGLPWSLNMPLLMLVGLENHIAEPLIRLI